MHKSRSVEQFSPRQVREGDGLVAARRREVEASVQDVARTVFATSPGLYQALEAEVAAAHLALQNIQTGEADVAQASGRATLQSTVEYGSAN